MTIARDELERCLGVLQRGGMVACPTETFVGLLADALDARAVQRVCELKGRDVHNPIGLLIADAAGLARVARALSPLALELATRHWPGPLTLVVSAAPGLPEALLKDGKVGVRVPGPSPALDLVRAFARPLTATSANLSGQPSLRDTAELRASFGDRIDRIDHIVAGSSPGGLASTVVDVTGESPKILRQGALVLGSL